MSTPVSITDHQRSRILQIDWVDASSSHLPHSLLRASCRCAHCEQLRRIGRSTPTDPAVTLVSMAAVGEHGLNLGFSDGHARGIYPWHWLQELGASKPVSDSPTPSAT